MCLMTTTLVPILLVVNHLKLTTSMLNHLSFTDLTSISAMAERPNMLWYSNLMTGGVGLYCDVLVTVGFICF